MPEMVQLHPHHFLLYELLSRITNLLVVPPTTSKPFVTPPLCPSAPSSNTLSLDVKGHCPPRHSLGAPYSRKLSQTHYTFFPTS